MRQQERKTWRLGRNTLGNSRAVQFTQRVQSRRKKAPGQTIESCAADGVDRVVLQTTDHSAEFEGWGSRLGAEPICTTPWNSMLTQDLLLDDRTTQEVP
jgi:hypothetical protein